MNKEEFIKELESKLELLDDEKKSEVIKKYKTTITNRKKKKEKEEDIIASFGDIELLTKNILKENNVKTPEVKQKESANLFFENFFSTLRGVVSAISEKDFKTIFLIIGELLLIIIVVCLLKIPFILGRDLLLSLYDSLGGGYNTKAADITITLFELAYILFAVFIFINQFTNRFKKYKK